MAKRVDANQSDIVKALRKLGASVQTLHEVGKGCPDILVGHRSKNYLLELKDGTKSPSRRKLTDDEFRWHATWNGTVYVVESVDEAIEVMRL